ncbi:histone acetylation protein-domain-containing protein [Fennellomyces sp. T-0311]|nr:histone acetylation protein-domain-containing protein [Fennellomyces sp. T-0311]
MEKKTLYIGKVDSTGTHRGVISKVIQAYVKSETPCRVHVFARSQPQYLFHRSAMNKDKPVLSDRDLIRWWYKVLSFGQGWWSIPGIDDEASARHELGRPKQGGWKYGYPYDPDARAAQVVPRFNDDAKSRLLNKGEDMSVKDFWTMLGITEECGHHLTGFFVADVDGPSGGPREKRGIDGEEYTLFWNYFMDLSFEDSDSVTESTWKLVSKWTQLGFGDPARFVTRGPAYSPTAQPPNRVNVLSTAKRKPEVNTLSASAIRRRPESVNTLLARPKRPRTDD